jgi:hypothetical protein
VESRLPRRRVVKAIIQAAIPNPSPQSVTETLKQPKMIPTGKTARSKKPENKPAAAPRPATVKPKKKAREIVKNAADKTTTTNLVITAQANTSPLEDTSDLLHRLHIQACVELTHQLLASICPIPAGEARLRADHYPVRG